MLIQTCQAISEIQTKHEHRADVAHKLTVPVLNFRLRATPSQPSDMVGWQALGAAIWALPTATLAWGMIAAAVVTFVTLLVGPVAPYGR